MLPVTPAFSAEADLSWTDLSQEYDGQLKSPVVTTEPPNLEVTLEYFPRSNSEVLFQRIPEIDQPSYPSYGLNGKSDIGLGDLVDLEIDNQRLESVDVVMVNFAQAASWPQLAEENSEGYFHPLTLTIYRVLGDDLFLVTEKTQDVLIPWRPATLDDGEEYPYGGRAFRARFNFTEEKFLAGNLALVISYNTSEGGPAPLGVAGPYDSLNVALNDDTPLVGSDDNPSRVVRQTASRIYQSGAFGTRAPMFVVRGFPASPATGQPIEAGGYLVRATVDDGDFTAEAYENFEITPQEVELELLGVRQIADGSPKTIEVAEIPEGSSVEVVFARRDDLPMERGLYPFFVRLSGGNFVGSRSGVMRLGYSFESWASEKISAPGQRARDDDPDGDGMGNFHEYLSASDPVDAADFQAELLTLNQGSEGPVLEFLRNNEATDVIYILEESADLGPAAVWSALPVPPENTNPFVDSETVEVPLSALTDEKRFFRLRCETVPIP
ncbi:MBG domain-containing protein [Akkermansiaceae bacterium]|nr:MBG domain-containing protein [Akkermansiaceae bacterium]MDB4695350.1 MBG domain-containing protein [Akkermansiaceae bacterium]